MIDKGLKFPHLNLGAKSFFTVSHVSMEAQGFEPSSAAFAGHLAGRWISSGAAGT